ncbi:RDD family protein [Nocardia cyriacigeorgica]|uniref:RDD family n=1 Tax=Nocardia cyriacigeorgica TaxID=135487 RepID=A0A2L2JUK1_9NOCA|nr:RDD family protein [Nocardia cyriacigeorgica]AVH23506.1 RDD family protein [Nocardia cyriacigeorgica]MBF6161778.1 RDD family protein [Nocardia cyriacigeorgica]MBF6200576.1 RDD family protein [Nocardia cyriacigeorgica]MBF6317292.1 RDD family protein [Nocardia cyriacigeorgica]MBF6323086.1 RDD family protein [Nocardia cyriacigeorgica]
MVSAGGYDPRLGSATGVTPGGLGKRTAARFIDWILAAIIGAIFFWLLNMIWDTPDWVSILPGAGFGFLYFLAFEVSTGSTPGKKILGLHVNGSGGAPKPSVKDSAVRNAYMLLNLIPWVGPILWFIAAIAIAVTISSSPTKQGWHDKLAGTQVIDE